MADKTITIRLSGAAFKFKADDSVKDPDAVVRFITERIEKIQKGSGKKFRRKDPVILLLTALLDLSVEYLELAEKNPAPLPKQSLSFEREQTSETLEPGVLKEQNSDSASPCSSALQEVDDISIPLDPENPDGTEASLISEYPEEPPEEPDSKPVFAEIKREENSSFSGATGFGSQKSLEEVRERPHFQMPLPGHGPDPNEGDETVALHTPVDRMGFRLPHPGLLSSPSSTVDEKIHEDLREKGELLGQKLEDFGIHGEVVQISPGPVITTFSFRPAPGVKISRIVSLADDLALALSAFGIRILAPIPGKDVIGVEIPNQQRQIVGFKEMVSSPVFRQSPSCLTLCLGKDIKGRPKTADLAKMPHLLIAGATGTGKSVALNAMVLSMLFKADPDAVKLIMIDPKRIELSLYADLPHLITPVVCDMKEATGALFWAVEEMERRYELLAESRVRSIDRYNEKAVHGSGQRLPYIVVIIDELADLMMVSSRDVEVALTRLAQMARAAGIHLILATQRPSVDVLTGVIKANFPTRISFKVSSKIDSRTILDANGAESLLGKGDMLFLPPGTSELARLHGPFVDEGDINRVTGFIKTQRAPSYIREVTERRNGRSTDNGETEYDELYDEAVALVVRSGQASISNIQRHMRIGYNRAARIVDVMEKEGVVGPPDGSKPREVLIKEMDLPE